MTVLFFPNVNNDFIHGEHQCPQIIPFLEQNKSKFEHSLIGDLSHINLRATCCNGIELEHLQYISNNEYYLEYSYVWHVYNGCVNMDEEKEESDNISFSIGSKGEIKFDFTILEERTTYKEF